MKTLKESLNEHWNNSQKNSAYTNMVDIFSMMSGEQITDLLWNYFDSDTIEDLYEYMKDEGILH